MRVLVCRVVACIAFLCFVPLFGPCVGLLDGWICLFTLCAYVLCARFESSRVNSWTDFIFFPVVVCLVRQFVFDSIRVGFWLDCLLAVSAPQLVSLFCIRAWLPARLLLRCFFVLDNGSALECNERCLSAALLPTFNSIPITVDVFSVVVVCLIIVFFVRLLGLFICFFVRLSPLSC